MKVALAEHQQGDDAVVLVLGPFDPVGHVARRLDLFLIDLDDNVAGSQALLGGRAFGLDAPQGL